MTESVQFGSSTPFGEPAWYNSKNASPYYNEHHIKFRQQMRDFVESEIIPNVDNWENGNSIPREVYKKAYEVGLLPTILGWPEVIQAEKPRPEGFDGLFILIAFDELCRCCSGGVVWGLVGALGIGAPPILHQDQEWMKEQVLLPAIRGETSCCLCVSEPKAGSDVANLTATAIEDESGEFYIIEGAKKWITGGMFSKWATVAARTGGEGSGMLGISLILVDLESPGVSRRQMDCMGAKGSGTAFIEFDQVKVPTSHYIGNISMLLSNFVTERLGIALQANRFARECLREAVEHVKRRKAFGKTLADQPVVRNKIAIMAQKVESTHAYIESVAFRLVHLERQGLDWFSLILDLGSDAALAKVTATDTFEFCAREAAYLFGGQSYVKGGNGGRIEALYRDVISLAVPGGSRDVLLDYAAKLKLKGKL